MTTRPYNFSAGPAILPSPVLERVARAVGALRGTGFGGDGIESGLSILEISHRGPAFTSIHERAVELVHEVIGVPRDARVMFLQGGASLQFCMVPLNLRREGTTAFYVETGAWAKKAAAEAERTGPTRVVASSRQTGFDRIPAVPDGVDWGSAAYLHITTNNTIYGTEYRTFPEVPASVPLVADLSSDIASRPMPLDRVALGYAGAQKNLGPSGVTLVFGRRDLIDGSDPDGLPAYLRYATFARAGGLYNTPNTFGILVLAAMLEWVRDEGGVAAMAERNERKARKIYDVLDALDLYEPHAVPEHRSWMNVTFRLSGKDDDERKERTDRFLRQAEAAGFSGLKGHRSVGGVRASIYNAFPEAGVDAFVEFLREFARRA